MHRVSSSIIVGTFSAFAFLLLGNAFLAAVFTALTASSLYEDKSKLAKYTRLAFLLISFCLLCWGIYKHATG